MFVLDNDHKLTLRLVDYMSFVNGKCRIGRYSFILEPKHTYFLGSCHFKEIYHDHTSPSFWKMEECIDMMENLNQQKMRVNKFTVADCRTFFKVEDFITFLRFFCKGVFNVNALKLDALPKKLLPYLKLMDLDIQVLHLRQGTLDSVFKNTL